jgi:energy-coupling factor transporter ATP-binding protein EcfA2
LTIADPQDKSENPKSDAFEKRSLRIKEEAMKHFNTEGVCRPDCNYMVKTDDILGEIKSLIDSNNYIILNRPRQFGKTTTLALLQKVLEPQYAYINISIEDFTESDFTERGFSKALHLIISDYFNDSAPGLSEEAKKAFLSTYEDMKDDFDLRAVTSAFKHMCLASDKRIVLAIDEIDAAEGCEAFFGLLAFLRSKYNDNPENTFQSVILVGVYDIWRLSNYRSPWNIAVYFDESLGLPKRGILEMLEEYKADHGLKFDAARMSALLSEYTSGYPFLVSKLCTIIHSELLETARFADLDAAWTREGFLAALQILKSDDSLTIFRSLARQLEGNIELKGVL